MPLDNKPKPVSVSLSPDLIGHLDARAGKTGKTRSAVLVDDLTAYADYLDLAAAKGRDPKRLIPDSLNLYALLALGLARAKKKLTRSEAKLILDVQNGSWADGSLPVWINGGLAHQVEDGIALEGLADKWGVDGPALVAKLEAPGDLETVGLIDWAARFWEGDIQADDAVGRAVAGFLEG